MEALPSSPFFLFFKSRIVLKTLKVSHEIHVNSKLLDLSSETFDIKLKLPLNFSYTRNIVISPDWNESAEKLNSRGVLLKKLEWESSKLLYSGDNVWVLANSLYLASQYLKFCEHSNLNCPLVSEVWEHAKRCVAIDWWHRFITLNLRQWYFRDHQWNIRHTRK